MDYREMGATDRLHDMTDVSGVNLFSNHYTLEGSTVPSVDYGHLHCKASEGVTEYQLPPGTIHDLYLSVQPPALELIPLPPKDIPIDPQLHPLLPILTENLSNTISEAEWIQKTKELILHPYQPLTPPRPGIEGALHSLSKSHPIVYQTDALGARVHPGFYSYWTDLLPEELTSQTWNTILSSTLCLTRQYPLLTTEESRAPWETLPPSGLSALIYQPYAREGVSSANLWYWGALLYLVKLPPPVPRGATSGLIREITRVWRGVLCLLDTYATEASYCGNALYSSGEGSLLTDPIVPIEEGCTIWIFYRGILRTLPEMWMAVEELLTVPELDQRYPCPYRVCLEHLREYTSSLSRRGPGPLPEPLQSQVQLYSRVEAVVVQTVSGMYDQIPHLPRLETYPPPDPRRYQGRSYEETAYYSHLHLSMVPAPIPPPDPLPPALYSVPDVLYRNIPHRSVRLPLELPLRPPRGGGYTWWHVSHQHAARELDLLRYTMDQWKEHQRACEASLSWRLSLERLPLGRASEWRRDARELVPEEQWIEADEQTESIAHERAGYLLLSLHRIYHFPGVMELLTTTSMEHLHRRLREHLPPELFQLVNQLGSALSCIYQLTPRALDMAMPARQGSNQVWFSSPLERIDTVTLLGGGRVIEKTTGEWLAFWERARRGSSDRLAEEGYCNLPLSSLVRGVEADTLRIRWRPTTEWAIPPLGYTWRGRVLWDTRLYWRITDLPALGMARTLQWWDTPGEIRIEDPITLLAVINRPRYVRREQLQPMTKPNIRELLSLTPDHPVFQKIRVTLRDEQDRIGDLDYLCAQLRFSLRAAPSLLRERLLWIVRRDHLHLLWPNYHDYVHHWSEICLHYALNLPAPVAPKDPIEGWIWVAGQLEGLELEGDLDLGEWWWAVQVLTELWWKSSYTNEEEEEIVMQDRETKLQIEQHTVHRLPYDVKEEHLVLSPAPTMTGLGARKVRSVQWEGERLYALGS